MTTHITYPQDRIPHTCMHCGNGRVVQHFGRDAMACKEAARHIKDAGFPLLLDEVLVNIDGGECCEAWEAMSERVAVRTWGEDYAGQFNGMWG